MNDYIILSLAFFTLFFSIINTIFSKNLHKYLIYSSIIYFFALVMMYLMLSEANKLLFSNIDGLMDVLPTAVSLTKIYIFMMLFLSIVKAIYFKFKK